MSDASTHQELCPNCNTLLQGEYCYKCGQKKIHQPETVGHIVRHFLDDITHFDSKFFKSLVPLLFKPGFLTKEYIAGRRASYLHPIRSYLFLSFIYFLLFFSFETATEELNDVNIESVVAAREIDSLKNSSPAMRMAIDSIESKSVNIKVLVDSLKKTNQHVKAILDSLQNSEVDLVIDPMNPQALSKIKLDTINIERYVELQKTLPDSMRDSWFKSLLIRTTLQNTKKYNNDGKALWKDMITKYIHSIPKVLFFLLPIFALLLKLLYVRRKIYYVPHAIFSLHYFSLLFILFSVALIIERLFHIPGIYRAALIISLIYLWLNMYKFYEQGWIKTTIKFLILAPVFLLIMSVVSLISLFISFLTL
ncbi:MAG: DUF3667 domain-containing protein [Bacteroidia bacterium]